MTIWITTNGRPSNGAKALSKQDGFARAVKGGKIKPHHMLINWGSSRPWNWPLAGRIFNNPRAVAIAADKLEAFKLMSWPDKHVDTVEWTPNKAVAQSWSDQDNVVVVRTKLTGHSGDGIIIVEKNNQVPDAPLYTKYVFKDKEFRVHVVGDQVIDTQRKIRDPDREPIDWKVRSHDNGFIYARGNIDPSVDRDNLAIAATKALGLDFGAVDIIQDKAGSYYVLECNTAPGLEGQTIDKYAEAFRNAGK